MKRHTLARKGLTLIELVIVILIIGFLMVFLGSAIRNLIVPSTEDISIKLTEAFRFGGEKAQLLNQTTLFRYDFEKSEYQFFLLKREEGGLEEEPILKKVKLPFYGKILKARDATGQLVSEGSLSILFRPQGITTDTFLYIGSDTEIKKTIQLFRYAGKMMIHPGEYIPEDSKLEKVTYGLDDRDEQNEILQKKK